MKVTNGSTVNILFVVNVAEFSYFLLHKDTA